MINLHAMNDTELSEIAKDLVTRKILDAVPQDLAPVGTLVRLLPGNSSEAPVLGILGRISLWCDRNPSNAFPRADSRIALVRLVDSVLPVVRNGSLITDEECLVYEEDLELVQKTSKPARQIQ